MYNNIGQNLKKQNNYTRKKYVRSSIVSMLYMFCKKNSRYFLYTPVHVRHKKLRCTLVYYSNLAGSLPTIKLVHVFNHPPQILR